MIKKKKILFFVYCLLVSALSIGWYPQNQNKQVKKDITLVRKSSEKMAALVENNQFCYQGVTETDMDERRMNAQEDEKQRRTVKTIVRYRVNLEHGARRIVWRVGAILFGPQPRKYDFKVNKKIRKLALRMALSSRLAGDNLLVVKGFGLPEAETKE